MGCAPAQAAFPSVLAGRSAAVAVVIAEARYTLAQAVAEAVEVLAIGDIHGEAGLLEALLAHAAALPPQGRRVLVFTGDLIDRGPASLAALRLAAEAGARLGAVETVALMGNHEQMLRCALAGVPRRRLETFALWVANGGDALLDEVFGSDRDRCDHPQMLEAEMGEGFGFIEDMRSHWRSGDVLFVHAGLSPTMPRDAFLAAPWDVAFDGLREAEHWAWIRGPFLEAPSHGGLFVVHGHTPDDNAKRAGAETVARDRLNLDLGSTRTGMARMARIVGREVTVYDAIDA